MSTIRDHHQRAVVNRYETRLSDGVLYLETDEGWLEIGRIADVVDAIGGETYVVEYDPDDAAVFDWLDTDEQGRLEIEVRETVQELTFQKNFVGMVADVPLENDAGEPYRPEFFTDMLTSIWDSKGKMDDADASE